MLALVENILIADIQDRPDLGCAMLMAACSKRGVDVRLIRGQTRFMRDLFYEDADELWDLLNEYEYKDKVMFFDKSIRDCSFKEFAESLKNKYDSVLGSKNPKVYLNAEMISEFVHLYSSIMSICSHHLENGYNLKLIDRYIDEIKNVGAAAVGFSLWSQRTSYGCTAYDLFTKTIRRRLKEECDAKIIIGGPFTAFIDDAEMVNLFENDHVDYLILGAGEHALPRLMCALGGDGSVDDLDNLVYEKRGKLSFGSPSGIDNLDDLPYPEFNQFDLDRYASPERLLPISTSRGCSWGKCAFCGYGAINCNQYRRMSAEKVVDMLKYLQNEYQCRYFAMHEEQITPEAAQQLCECIIREEMDVRISAYARFESGYNDENLWQMLYGAGFRSFNWGLESGNQRVLNLMRKGIEVENIKEVLRKSQRNGISNNVFIFFGFPGETKEEADDTVRFLRNNHESISAVEYGTFVFAKKAPINVDPGKWGVKKIDGEYVYPDGGMSQDEVETYHDEFKRGVLTGDLRIQSMPYTPPPFLSQMYCLMISAHGIMKSEDIFSAIAKLDYDKVYPVILGESYSVDGVKMFAPAEVDDTVLNNIIKPKEMIQLDGLVSQVIKISDGSRTIRDIVNCISANDRRDRCIVEREIVKIFEEIYSKNMGLAFTERWLR